MLIRKKIYFVNQINLFAAEAGSPDGKIILFLHGFPEFWYAWHQQLPFFADKGFRAIALDQRGYNLSSKPKGVKAYALPHLTEDIAAFICHLTAEKIILVGHDWGGAVAWSVAAHYPQLLEKLVILNMPHLQIFNQYIRKNPKQLLKSWYAGFFQLPILPELSNRVFNYRLLKMSMVRTALPNTFSEDDFIQYNIAWRKPGALKAMINWYRAYKYNTKISPAPIEVPTLLIWGQKDAFLKAQMAAPSVEKCRHGKLIFLPEATHWLHHEKPHQVNKLIYQFIQNGN